MSERRILLKHEVLARVRLSNPTIYRLRRKGKFPEPFVIGEQKVAWFADEIEAWLEARERTSLAPAEAA
ncbi:AlpA family phage regulatory protein [Enterovirga sp.]|uniref:helix-turn-helix transcriptional regulator n=1 Tax=Enterovirga sp. TaxID=2026350 RepID=UPI002D05748F|nr:AlpA family phage regulatory protein [Enterovirga sp.]HMO29840.1 AlpA family phage regulatory protein [Enterovirga sp.]